MALKKLVMFDFDGVIANTIRHSFDKQKGSNPNLTWQRFKDFSNGNFIDGIGKAVEDGHHIIPKDFFGNYNKHIESDILHNELKDLIMKLAEDNILAIVSSTKDSSIELFLTKENIRSCFSDILGSDVHKSKVVKIQNILSKYNIAPKDAVIITDSLGDVLEASECGVASVAVLWGIHERETLEQGNPAKIIDNPSDLLNAVKEVLG